MSIVNTNINTQTILFSKEKKEKYGEILHLILIHKMFELLMMMFFLTQTIMVDPGAGTGFFYLSILEIR